MSGDFLSRAGAPIDAAEEPLRQDPDHAAIREEVSALFVTLSPALTRYLRARYGDEHAEEFAQEAFLRMYDLRVRGGQIDSPEGWLIAVSRRIAISWWRKTGRDQRGLREFEALLDDIGLTASPEAIWLDHERITAVKHAEQRLTDLERTCLSMRLRGMTLEEVGRHVQMNFRRVAEVVSRAIGKLNAAQG